MQACDQDHHLAEQPVIVSGDLTQPGIRFEANAAKWVVRPDRLSVESGRSDVDCGELVQKTLAALCWTPHNAMFEIQEMNQQG